MNSLAPHHYQSRVNDTLREHRSALLVMPYGAGKTAVILTHVANMPVAHPLLAVIFCAKRNVMTWRQEAAKWLPDVLVFTELSEKAMVCCEPHIIILTHRRIVIEYAALIRLSSPLWVIDESTVIKNPKAAITKHAIQLSAAHPDADKIAMTGNPIPESEREIWSQFAFVYGAINPLGSSWYQFNRINYLVDGYVWSLRSERRDWLYETIRKHTIHLSPEEIAEFKRLVGIDKRNYVMAGFEETAEQRRLLTKLDKTWSLPDGAGEDIQYNHTMALLMKRQQIASGFYYVPHNEFSSVTLKANPKADLLVEVVGELLEAGHKRIVVWHAFEAEAQLIKAAVLMAPYAADMRVDEFNDVSRVRFADISYTYPTLIMVPLGMARGINDLVTASVDIFYSNRYNQELRDQAEARVDRLGQTSDTVTHIDLCCPTLWDTEIVVALQSKSLTQDRLNTITRRRK